MIRIKHRFRYGGGATSRPDVRKVNRRSWYQLLGQGNGYLRGDSV